MSDKELEFLANQVLDFRKKLEFSKKPKRFEFSKLVVLVSVLIFGGVLVLNLLGHTSGDEITHAKWLVGIVFAAYQIKSGVENKAKIECSRKRGEVA